VEGYLIFGIGHYIGYTPTSLIGVGPSMSFLFRSLRLIYHRWSRALFPLVFLPMGPVASRKKILTKKDIDTPHYDQQIGIRPTKRMKVIDRWERHEQNTIRGMSGEALQARLLCVDCMPSFFLANRHNILIILQIFLLRLRSPHSCFFCFNPHYCCQRN
jgi:hypothetical protein